MAQTVWNVLHGLEASDAIKDYDLVYFDAVDLRVETEGEIEAEVADRLRSLGIVVSRRRRGPSLVRAHFGSHQLTKVTISMPKLDELRHRARQRGSP